MIYRLYIYNTDIVTASAPAIEYINNSLSAGSQQYWEEHEAAKYMTLFNAEEIGERIKAELGEKCQVCICLPPVRCEQTEYLFISTSYDRAREILPRIHEIAAENRLALYDAESKKVFFKNLYDDTLIDIRLRAKRLNDCISKDSAPVWRIIKIQDHYNEWNKNSCYSVILKKDRQKTFLERVTAFHECLINNISKGEKLVSETDSFKVYGNGYSITYVLEGYKKHADLVGYYENGRAQQRPANRMGIESAFKWMNECDDEEKNIIFQRMNFREMENEFPNPSDRFVKSVRITKWQRRQIFDVRYIGINSRSYGSGFLFHIVPNGFSQDSEERDEISVLKIDDDSAWFILPFILDIYPYFQERDSLSDNHLPIEMWRDIIEKIKEAKNWVLYDTYNPIYKKYIDRFMLYVFDDYQYETDRTDFVFAHRFEIADLYEIFIQWSEVQMNCYYYTCCGRMFNIKGP